MAGTMTDNISAFWKEKFKLHPKFLNQRSNDELYQMYLDDHPGETEVPLNYKQGLSNVKSQMRSNPDDQPVVKRKVGRPRKDASASNGVAATNGAAPMPAAAAVKSVRAPGRSLESLEEQIDECLFLAKSMELASVALSLRRARNEIIIKRGS